MLVLLIGIRKLLDFVFTRHELKVLDDVFPQSRRQEKMEQEEERRKSVDHGDLRFLSNQESEQDVRKRKTGTGHEGPFVHFTDVSPSFPEYNSEGAINIKLDKNGFAQSDPDILKQV